MDAHNSWLDLGLITGAICLFLIFLEVKIRRRELGDD